MTTPTDSQGASGIEARPMLVVRPNRQRCFWVAALCVPQFLVHVLLLSELPPTHDSKLLQLVSAGAFGFGYWGAMHLFRKRYLAFDHSTGTLWGSHHYGRARYPRPGFDRLEYCVYDARIYEVATDGKRRRVPDTSWWVNREDWRALADTLLDTAPGSEQTMAEKHHDPAPARLPRPVQGRRVKAAW
jgi:hypothetical protein